MIKFHYEPLNLIETAAKVKKEHRIKSAAVRHKISQDEGKTIIREAVDQPDHALKSYALLLADYKKAYIARYVPYNSFHAALPKLVLILKYCMDPALFEILYYHWAFSYQEPQVIQLLEDCIRNAEAYGLSDCLVRIHLTAETFHSWTASDEIETNVCRELIRYKNREKVSFEEAVAAHGLTDTTLAIEAEKYFLLFCSKDDYNSISVERITAAIAGLATKQLMAFFLNFLYEFSDDIETLAERYQTLWTKAYNLIGKPSPSVEQQFFSGKNRRSKKAWQTYQKWYALHELYHRISDQSRRAFWEARIKEYSPYFVYYPARDLLYMQFEGKNKMQLCAIEFGAIGKVYLFSKPYYDRNIQKLLAKSTNDLKSDLFHFHVKNEEFPNSFIHNGGWEYKVREQMRKLLG